MGFDNQQKLCTGWAKPMTGLESQSPRHNVTEFLRTEYSEFLKHVTRAPDTRKRSRPADFTLCCSCIALVFPTFPIPSTNISTKISPLSRKRTPPPTALACCSPPRSQPGAAGAPRPRADQSVSQPPASADPWRRRGGGRWRW